MKLKPATHKNDGIIFPSHSKLAKELGFTSDKFTSESYLGKKGDYIYLSFIHSQKEGKGYLSQLMRNIFRASYGVKIPTPMGKMEEIVRKKEFIQTWEYSKAMGDEPVEVWVKEFEMCHNEVL